MPDSADTGTPQGAVFLSYASQDAEAARRICEALRSAGIEVWFDQSELRGGDSWDRKIRRQIKECALFVPVISANTNSRQEGYFRLEWKLAVDRSHLMAEDAPYLFPVVIDDTSDAKARVPDKFRDVQWTRLNVKDTPPMLAERVKKLLSRSDAEPAKQSPTTGGSRPVSNPVRHSRPWLIPAIAGVIACAALAIWQPWHKGEKPSAPVSASEPRAEIKQLLERATAMTTINATLDDLSTEDYEAAAKLIEQAKALDPLDGEVCAKEALNDVNFVRHVIGTPQTRKERAATEAARAVQLSPNSYSARLAHAQVLQWVVAPSGGSPEAEHLARELLLEKPDDQEAQVTLGEALNSEGRHGEAGDFYLKAKLPFMAALAYYSNGQVADAISAADQALALKRSVKNLMLKISVTMFSEGGRGPHR